MRSELRERAGATVRDAFATLRRCLRALAGLPDYEAYLEHCRMRHPERVPLDRAAFLREREAARYARERNRCC